MNALKNKLSKYAMRITPLPNEDGGGYSATYEELRATVRGIGSTPSEALEMLEEMALDGLEGESLSEFPPAMPTG